ncbi:hypothetical protein MU0083_003669 [[Mycobacterium] kokjensenii]|uniref:Uncharacterized protein n=1 Tax=[Mycobacterium] kokjensenii TaxID=3064287 RepID=A0ABN9NF57_9MYCO|nr:hypothetical protein [Mycolicibacter sp. MU0083]CAJ1505345.1 hypothetical protein MU0083_003669 [Mycolicibacter sp. MU0083]
MRAEEGDESIRDYAHQARETRERVGHPTWSARLRHAWNTFRRRR